MLSVKKVLKGTIDLQIYRFIRTFALVKQLKTLKTMVNFNDWSTPDLEQAISEDVSTYDVLYQIQCVLDKYKYRELLIEIANGVLTSKD